MKRTTYIIIGMLALGLVALLAVVFGLSMYQKQSTNENPFSDSLTMDVSGIRRVEFKVDNEELKSFVLGSLLIEPVRAGMGVLVFPKDASNLFTVKRDSDLLRVVFRADKETWIKELGENNGQQAFPLKFKLAVDSSLICVTTESIDLTLSRLTSDTISVSSAHMLRADSCRLGALSASAMSRVVNLSYNTIRDLYLDLDGKWSLLLDENRIETSHLTGSQIHSYNLSNDKTHRFVWTPKTDKAELRMELKEKRTVVWELE